MKRKCKFFGCLILISSLCISCKKDKTAEVIPPVELKTFWKFGSNRYTEHLIFKYDTVNHFMVFNDEDKTADNTIILFSEPMEMNKTYQVVREDAAMNSNQVKIQMIVDGQFYYGLSMPQNVVKTQIINGKPHIFFDNVKMKLNLDSTNITLSSARVII